MKADVIIFVIIGVFGMAPQPEVDQAWGAKREVENPP